MRKKWWNLCPVVRFNRYAPVPRFGKPTGKTARLKKSGYLINKWNERFEKSMHEINWRNCCFWSGVFKNVNFIENADFLAFLVKSFFIQ